MINIAQPSMGDAELEAVTSVIRSGMLAQGPRVAELEANFAAYCGTKYAIAVNSGTAAIHSALFAAGIGVGDEVITTPFSFIATINPILMMGAKPILVDIDPTTYNLNPALVAKAIGPRTKAILPVHLYGQPCDFNEISELANKNDLRIIEDACQAVGATYGKRKTGNLGDMGAFSLYATKNIMSGEGGMVTTNSKDYADTIKRFRQHGMSNTYQYEHLGYNYRMTDLQASIALVQLKKADDFNRARQINAERLTRNLSLVPGLVLPKISPNRTHVFHQYVIRITPDFGSSRENLVKILREGGVGTGIYYPKTLHTIPHIAKFGYTQGQFPEAEEAAREVLALPVHPLVSKSDIDLISSIIKKVSRG